ncbi:MAG: hypothetical protein ACT4OV_04150 [Microthrixaceae bacterium]
MHRTITCIAGAAALALTLAGCGSSGGSAKPAACTPVASSITVGALNNLKFDAASYEATTGCVQMTYRNEGSLAHTLLVKGQPGFKLAVGDEDVGRLELKPGTYKLYCDVAGHEAAGMVADLTVK